jgi:c-di-AMP phosphodiesterase-like protein
MFYNSMTVGSDGHDQVQNYQAKPSTQGEAVTALVSAYTLTHHQHYLDVAAQVLQSLFGPSGLWDQQRGGLYFAFDMQAGKLLNSYKETRSQTLTLISLHNYDQAVRPTGNQPFTQLEQQLITVLTDHFYERTYHGFFYRVTPDFQVYVDKAGQGIGVEDYFTTEAMGSATDALQQMEFAVP